MAVSSSKNWRQRGLAHRNTKMEMSTERNLQRAKAKLYKECCWCRRAQVANDQNQKTDQIVQKNSFRNRFSGGARRDRAKPWPKPKVAQTKRHTGLVRRRADPRVKTAENQKSTTQQNRQSENETVKRNLNRWNPFETEQSRPKTVCRNGQAKPWPRNQVSQTKRHTRPGKRRKAPKVKNPADNWKS